MTSSRISGFENWSPGQRIDFLRDYASLDGHETDILKRSLKCPKLFSEAEDSARNPFSRYAQGMSENVVGTFGGFPYSVAANFRINSVDYLVPMITEEACVVAAASNASRLFRTNGGITSRYLVEPTSFGYIYWRDLENPRDAVERVNHDAKNILKEVNNGREHTRALSLFPEIFGNNGMRVEIEVDTGDAMGANAINSIAEKASDYLKTVLDGKRTMAILSNYSKNHIIEARVVAEKKEAKTLGFDQKSFRDIEEAYRISLLDPTRAVTHNKGIMNGIEPVARATFNDTRALEAEAYFHAVEGGYMPLTEWHAYGDRIEGKISIPIKVGTRGGSTSHPIAKLSRKILSANLDHEITSKELGEVMAAVGLAQNFAALYALVTEGIQKGHMELHRKKF